MQNRFQDQGHFSSVWSLLWTSLSFEELFLTTAFYLFNTDISSLTLWHGSLDKQTCNQISIKYVINQYCIIKSRRLDENAFFYYFSVIFTGILETQTDFQWIFPRFLFVEKFCFIRYLLCLFNFRNHWKLHELDFLMKN